MLRVWPHARFVFVGDSIVRHVFNSLVHLLASADHPPPVPAKHADMHFNVGAAVSATFLWRPHTQNLTAAIETWTQVDPVPDIIVAGVALWHVLHTTDAVGYEKQLILLRGAWQALQQVCSSCCLVLSDFLRSCHASVLRLEREICAHIITIAC